MTALPKGDEYQQAVQTPTISFADAELKYCEVETTVLGLPKPYSGGFTTTYQLRGAKNWAVRCFTRELKDLQQRYQAIGRFLQHQNCPFLVQAIYLKDGIRVHNKPYPIIKMDWLEGETLNVYIENNRFLKHILKNLLDVFIELINDLDKLGIAHGDLQHGNILVQNDQLYLIDYDGMYLPELANLTANELGHPNFQHPARTVSDYDKNMDRFSAIVIYLAIKALMIDPKLWEMFENGENLLFKSDDFARPEISPLLQQLENYSELKEDVQNFKTICQLPYAEIPDLQAFQQGNFTYSAQAQRTFDGANHAVLLKHLGEKVNIITKIDTVYIGDAALFIFLNGESVGEKRFQLVIWSEEIIALQAQGMSIHSNGIRFENVDYLWIGVTGILSVHKGNPQVTLESPNQLQLLKDAVTAQNRLNSSQKKPSIPNKMPQKFEKPVSEEVFWSEYLNNQPNLPPTSWYIPPSGTATPVNPPTNNVNNVKVSKMSPTVATVISMGSLVSGMAATLVLQNALFLLVGVGIGIYAMVRD
jgi:serine/threonine protein kinase